MRHECFPPIIDRDVRVMLLGSFPGKRSLEAQAYYAHPQNSFWWILGEILDEPLTELAFEERYERLLAHHIGLWDVIGTCKRQGSMDADIREEDPNDFSVLKRAEDLRLVAFNGKKSGSYAKVVGAMGYPTAQLPSTSPAYATMRPAEKLAAWKEALLPVLEAA